MQKLFLRFITSVFLLTAIIFFITCKNEYSFEGGASTGTAVYTLAGEGGPCTGSVLSGEYYTGVALAAGNTVELHVHVSAIGTYTISTNSADGIHFSTSGNFIDTGMQVITLTGSGTPTAEGSFTFTTPVRSQCSFVVAVTTAPVAIASYTLTGSPNECEDAMVQGSYVAGLPFTVSNKVVVKVNVTAIGAYDIHTETLDGISFSKTGTFTTTGVQTVTLPGTGTPASPKNLLFTPMAATSGCTFNVTVLNPEPLATYVLESGFGSPNPCVYTVSGDYVTGTPLSNLNTVSMHVFVTFAGNFTISTQTVNGMTFSYTGSFTTTGAQSVTLTGSGTPLNPEISTIFPEIVGPHPLGGEICAFYVTVQ